MVSHAFRATIFCGAVISLNACSGVISGTSGDDVDVAGTPLSFQCTPNGDLPPSPIKRLSHREYEQTLADALGALVGSTEAQKALTAADGALSGLPADSTAVYALEGIRGASFSALDKTMSQSHVDGYYRVAVDVADALTSSAAGLGALMGECATDADASNDGACVEGFLHDAGRVALRRPLRPKELSFLREKVYGDGGQADTISATAARDALVVLLSSPQFLYHVEEGEAPVSGRKGQVTLSAHELASRLSYFFWGTMPDAALAALADDGSILEAEVYRAEVVRLFDDPRAEATLREFYSEWLLLSRVPHHYRLVGNARYDTFAGDLVPTPELRQAMIDEVLDLALHYSRAQDGRFSDLFTSEQSFARHADLARIYGVPVWDGQGEPPRFTDGARSGLLTRAALVSAEGIETHPVLKGVLIRRNILCDNLPPPPPDINRTSTLTPPYTRREEMANLTEQPGSSCTTCHSVVNALGNVTENFDGLGRVRSTEPFYLPDGKVLAELPVETSGAPQITDGDATVIDSGVALGRLIADSGKAHACFARHFYRFAQQRVEDLAADGCGLEDLRLSLEEGSLRDALMSIALHPSFKIRRIGD